MKHLRNLFIVASLIISFMLTSCGDGINNNSGLEHIQSPGDMNKFQHNSLMNNHSTNENFYENKLEEDLTEEDKDYYERKLKDERIQAKYDRWKKRAW